MDGKMVKEKLLDQVRNVMTLLPLAKPSRMDFTLSTKPLLPTPVKSGTAFNPSTVYKTYGAGAAGSKAFYPFL